MIVTVTLNLALDVTYTVDGLRVGAANRVRAVAHRAGGKGVNVARVLRALGADVLVTGLVGGPTGDVARAELAASGLPEKLYPITGETRRTVAVVDAVAGDATLFNEPGPWVRPSEWTGYLAAYEDLLGAHDVEAVVLSGSLPRGVRDDAYAMLGMLAAQRGVPVALDADGPALLAGLAARPALVKPNADELARVSGSADPLSDPLSAARELRDRGAGAVVCSRGPEGLLAVTPGGCWRALPPERVAGNPTGAGDAAVAGLVYGLVRGWDWPERLREAVALSAAAVLAPLAGGFDAAAYQRFRPAVTVTEMPVAAT